MIAIYEEKIKARRIIESEYLIKRVTTLLCPLSSLFQHNSCNNPGWREGASPPLKFSPPLKLKNIRAKPTKLFERGTKGLSNR
jgi:hypothetical protein